MIKEFINYIPESFTRDDKLVAFADKHDDLIDVTIEDILGLKNLYNPLRTSYIDYLAYFLNADVFSFDSEATKRKKVAKAVMGHKNRSLWEDDVKEKIDSIAGGDSQIIRAGDTADWVLLGQESSDPDNYWGTIGTDVIDTSDYVFESDTDFILAEANDTSSNGTIGTDGIDDFGGDLMGSQFGTEGDNGLGLDLIGAGDEIELAGNIYIDADNKILTEEELNKIIVTLGDSVPAYYIIYLGYYNAIGQFVVYTNGIIS